MDRTRLTMVGTTIVAALVAVGCTQLGTGDRRTEEREIGDATRIEVSGGIAVIVRIGQPTSATVSAQQNILPLVTVASEGGTLRIEPKQPFTTTERVEVDVTIPGLESLTASGGSAVTLTDVALDALTVELSGGSRLTGGKTVTGLDLTASGGSRAELDGLTATTVEVDASGGSVAELRATDSVTGSASGGARVSVRGGATVAVDSSGGATVDSE
jgi:hypothetical protein